jgi:hypothetical protein
MIREVRVPVALKQAIVTRLCQKTAVNYWTALDRCHRIGSYSRDRKLFRAVACPLNVFLALFGVDKGLSLV